MGYAGANFAEWCGHEGGIAGTNRPEKVIGIDLINQWRHALGHATPEPICASGRRTIVPRC